MYIQCLCFSLTNRKINDILKLKFWRKQNNGTFLNVKMSIAVSIAKLWGQKNYFLNTKCQAHKIILLRNLYVPLIWHVLELQFDHLAEYRIEYIVA